MNRRSENKYIDKHFTTVDFALSSVYSVVIGNDTKKVLKKKNLSQTTFILYNICNKNKSFFFYSNQ